MAKTFQRIGSYTSIVTVIGAIISAPAQAISLSNNTSDSGAIIRNSKANDLITNQSTSNNHTGEFNSTLEVQDNIKPQILAENEFTPRNQVWHGLLQKPEGTIDALEQASAVTEVKIDDSKTAYIDNSIQARNLNISNTNYTEYHTNIYSNISKGPTPHPRRKVPEPSTLTALIAISCYFATRRQLMKRT